MYKDQVELLAEWVADCLLASNEIDWENFNKRLSLLTAPSTISSQTSSSPRSG